jgi:hypothetical protein
LELQAKGDSQPELLPNEETQAVNLEHVLPQNPSLTWNVDQETASACFRRLGNMVLLKAEVNSVIGNAPFGDKKAFLAKSGFLLTKKVAKFKSWGMEQISERQKELAKLAVHAWPLDVR